MRFLYFITLFIAIVTQANSRSLGESNGLQQQRLGDDFENKWNEPDDKYDDFDGKIQSGWTGKQKDEDLIRLTLDGYDGFRYDEHNYDCDNLCDDSEDDYGTLGDGDDEYADYEDYDYDVLTSIPQEDSDLIVVNPHGLTVINYQPKMGLGRVAPTFGQVQIQHGSEIHPQVSMNNFVHPEEIVQYRQPQLDVSQPIIMFESDQREEALEQSNYLDETIDLEEYEFAPADLEYLENFEEHEEVEELNPSVQLQLPIDNDYSELNYLDYDSVPVLSDYQQEGLYSLVDVDGDGNPDYLIDESEPELLIFPEGAEVLEQETLLNPEGLISSQDSEVILYESPEYVDELSGEIIKPAEIVLVQPELIEAPVLLGPADEQQLLLEELDYFNSIEQKLKYPNVIKKGLNRSEILPESVVEPEEIVFDEAEYLDYLGELNHLGYLYEDPNYLLDLEREPFNYASKDPEYLFDENTTYFYDSDETALLDGSQEEPYVLSPEDEAYLKNKHPEVLEDLIHGDTGQLDSQNELLFDEEPEELDYLDSFEAPVLLDIRDEESDQQGGLDSLDQLQIDPNSLIGPEEEPLDYSYEDLAYLFNQNDEYFDGNDEPILSEDEQDGIDHLNTDYVAHLEEANCIEQYLEEPLTEYEDSEAFLPKDYEYVDEYGMPIHVDAEQVVYLDAREGTEQLQDEVEPFERHEPLTIPQAPVPLNQTQGESSQSINLAEEEQFDHAESIENVPF